jgi:putative spermidine/putrescine transport system ATP-binding protein
MVSPEPIVRFRDVSKTFDGVTDVVRGLVLDIAPGEFFSVLGPAGAGKTALLMLLAGFHAPTRGDIFLGGRLVNRTPPHRRELGAVLRSQALFPNMSVAENIAFPLTVRGVGRAERGQRILHVLDLVRLSDFSEHRPEQLSAGQQLRAALARALVHAPRVLLLDEPLAAIAPSLREEIFLDIRRIHREVGVSIIHATRDPAAALALSDRVGVLNHGVMEQVATPEMLYENPGTAFVARFVGDNNNLPGKIIGIEDDVARVRLLAGPEIFARVAGADRVGEACIVCIRPERVALAAASAAEMGEHALAAVILDFLYFGDHVRVRLAIGENAELTVKRPAAAGMAGFSVGQPVAVAWQDFHALAFRPDGASPRGLGSSAAGH